MAMKRKNKGEEGVPAGTGIPPHVLRFLNGLPVGTDIMESITQTKEALRRLLGDVDRIALYINTHCDPTYQPPENAGAFCISQIGPGDQTNSYDILIREFSYQNMLDIYLPHLRQAGFPFTEYQEPKVFLYSLPSQGDHLGAIILFRLRGLSPIPPATLELMEQLQPFILFLLTHLVYQRAYGIPKDIVFNDIITEVFRDLRLTLREKEVLTLRLLGLQKKTIADKLFISQETVSKHIQKILRKAGARNFLELFMRYYVPELEELGHPDGADIQAPKRPSGERRKKNRKDDVAEMPRRDVLLW